MVNPRVQRRSAGTARANAVEPSKGRCAARQMTQTHLHEFCGAPKPHDADEHAAVYATDERVLKEGRESRARCGAALYVLQFRPHPQNTSRDTRDAGRNHGSCLVA
jgi:hypothetical protein